MRRHSLVSGSFVLGIILTAACGKNSPTGNNNCEVTGVTVTPTPGNLEVGATANLSAQIAQTGCTGLSATWSTSNGAVATVSGTGVVTGVAIGGPVTITATVSGKSGTVNVTVVQAAVATVTVAAPYAKMPVGGTNTLAVVLKDARGAVLTGRTINYSSGNTGTATVAGGVVTGVAAGGPVTITVTSEGQVGSAPITVVPRYGYTFANNASASAPYDGNSLSTFNTIGSATTITRTATGTYTLRFRNMQAGAGAPTIILANALGSGNSTCFSTGVAEDGAQAERDDLIATVECRDIAGALVDLQFTATLFGKDAFPGRFAFAVGDQPSAGATYAATQAFNPAGQVQITRTGAGIYNVAFVGNTRALGTDPPETFLVTAAAGGLAKCEIPGWSYSTAQVTVRCADPLGAAMDSQFQIVMLEAGRPGLRHALAWADCSTVSCTPSATYQRSTGGTIAVTRTATGRYDVLFPGLARMTGTDNVIVTSYGSTGGFCKMTSVDNSGASDLLVQVQCFGPGGSVGDRRFDIAVVP